MLKQTRARTPIFIFRVDLIILILLAINYRSYSRSLVKKTSCWTRRRLKRCLLTFKSKSSDLIFNIKWTVGYHEKCKIKSAIKGTLF